MTAARASKPAVPISLDELLARDGDVTKHVGDRPFLWLVDPRVAPPEVLAFDLAAKGAWAFLGSKRRQFGIINAKEARIENEWIGALEDVIEAAKRLAGDAAGSFHGRRLLVVVEDTHLGSAAATPLAFAQITRYGAALAAVCAWQRLPMVRVPAGTWQRRLIGKVPRDQGKALSLAVARKRYGVGAITTEDMADAANLATYVRGGR
jgi:hypothetical protein